MPLNPVFFMKTHSRTMSWFRDHVALIQGNFYFPRVFIWDICDIYCVYRLETCRVLLYLNPTCKTVILFVFRFRWMCFLEAPIKQTFQFLNIQTWHEKEKTCLQSPIYLFAKTHFLPHLGLVHQTYAVCSWNADISFMHPHHALRPTVNINTQPHWTFTTNLDSLLHFHYEYN